MDGFRAEKRHELFGRANISEIQVHAFETHARDLVAKAISNKILRSNVPVVSTFTKGNVAILIYVEYLSVSRHDSMRTFYKIGVSIYREIQSARCNKFPIRSYTSGAGEKALLHGRLRERNERDG